MIRLLFLLVFLIPFSAISQDQVLAENLEPECKLAADGDFQGGGACILVLDGFVNGYMNGAKRGVRVAFLQDRQNLATTQGMPDAWRRDNRLYPSATCLPEMGTTKQVADVFVTYLIANPHRRKEHYGKVLTDAIESYFCARVQP